LWRDVIRHRGVTFDDGDPLERSSSTPADAPIRLEIEEDGGESSGSDADFDMEEVD